MDIQTKKRIYAKLGSTLILLLITSIWGFAFVAQIKSSGSVPPCMFNGIRFALGTLVLLPFVFILARKKFSENKSFMYLMKTSMIGGALLCAASAFQQYGCTFTQSAGLSGFVGGLYTVFTPIGCLILFRKKPKINMWIGFALAMLGLYVLSFYGVGSASNETASSGVSLLYPGIISLIICAIFYAAQIIYIEQISDGVNSLCFACGQFAFCSVFSLILGLMFELEGFSYEGQQIVCAFTWQGVRDSVWGILYLGVLSTAVAYTLQVVVQKRVDATYAAIMFTTESVFSAIGGAVFGIDKLTALGYLAFALIFSGIVTTQLEFKNKGTSKNS